MYVIHKRNIPSLLAFWGNSRTVLAPQSAGQGMPVALVPFHQENADALCFEYINTAKPVPETNVPAVLFTWEHKEKTYTATPHLPETLPSLYFGVRACDVAALQWQDQFYLHEYEDPHYAARRKTIAVVGLNCNRAGAHCFCAATHTGPFMETGADVVATFDGDELMLEAGSPEGEALLRAAAHILKEKDAAAWQHRKNALRAEALATFQLTPDLDGLAEPLAALYNHPLWEETAKTCIKCTGCTTLCPTCTCFQVVEERTGECSGTRVRQKDSCQTAGFTRNAGWHNPRTHTAGFRYRILDKLAYVEGRFKHKACVGCGRCITTCPAGIDITQIAQQIKTTWKAEGSPKPLMMPPLRYEKTDRPANTFLYTPRVAVITAIADETRDIKRYTLRYKDAVPGEHVSLDGQFYMLTVFGVGEIAVSIPFGDAPGTAIEFCIKKAGKVTNALAALEAGDEVGLRGPYGRGFPYAALKKRDVLIVGSGVGIAPVRTIIERISQELEDFGNVNIIASASTYSGLPYADDLRRYAGYKGVTVQYAFSQPTDKVNAHVGYINDLLPALPFNWPEAIAILCASPRRIKMVAADLLKLGMSPDRIYTSLETHMRCGVGKCGHCKVGSHYMCMDGPVFTYREMQELPPEF